MENSRWYRNVGRKVYVGEHRGRGVVQEKAENSRQAWWGGGGGGTGACLSGQVCPEEGEQRAHKPRPSTKPVPSPCPPSLLPPVPCGKAGRVRGMLRRETVLNANRRARPGKIMSVRHSNANKNHMASTPCTVPRTQRTQNNHRKNQERHAMYRHVARQNGYANEQV